MNVFQSLRPPQEIVDYVPPEWPITRKVVSQLTGWEHFLGENTEKAGIFPRGPAVFAALRTVNGPASVSCIILGQDPYPREQSAIGQAFNDGMVKNWAGKISPSLRNIVKMALVSDGLLNANATADQLRVALRGREQPGEWFKRLGEEGVLLINTALTYESTAALKSHQNFWRPVINAVFADVRHARKSQGGFVHVCFGAHAQKIGQAQGAQAAKDECPYAEADTCHPAIQAFTTEDPPPFEVIARAFEKLKLPHIKWVPMMVNK